LEPRETAEALLPGVPTAPSGAQGRSTRSRSTPRSRALGQGPPCVRRSPWRSRVPAMVEDHSQTVEGDHAGEGVGELIRQLQPVLNLPERLVRIAQLPQAEPAAERSCTDTGIVSSVLERERAVQQRIVQSRAFTRVDERLRRLAHSEERGPPRVMRLE